MNGAEVRQRRMQFDCGLLADMIGKGWGAVLVDEHVGDLRIVDAKMDAFTNTVCLVVESQLFRAVPVEELPLWRPTYRRAYHEAEV